MTKERFIVGKQVTGYEVDGHVVATLSELGDLLGVEKITKKDILLGGKYSDVVSLVDLEVDPENGNAPIIPGGNVDKSEVFTALSEDDKKNLANVDPEEIKASFPEFEDVDELKEFVKDIDTPTLEYLATGLGLEWNPTYHANIHRMRIAMELKKYFFPELFKPKESKKKKAKYGDFSTDKLFAMATEAEIEVVKTGNDPIDRMKAIMALKKAGVLAE